jgi:hypothetical protein
MTVIFPIISLIDYQIIESIIQIFTGDNTENTFPHWMQVLGGLVTD